MQTARSIPANATANYRKMPPDLNGSPVHTVKVLVIRKDVIRSLEQLLTRDEQAVCDMATD